MKEMALEKMRLDDLRPLLHVEKAIHLDIEQKAQNSVVNL